MTDLTTAVPGSAAPANTPIVTVGGKLGPIPDTFGNDAMGLVADAPAPLSLLGRLKAIATAIAGTASADDVFAIVPSDTVDLATTPKALLVTVAGNLAVRGTSGVTVTIPVVAGQVLPLRSRRIMTASTATVVGLA